MSDDDKIINFPGSTDAGGASDQPVSLPGDGSTGISGLSADQEKAIQVAVSGMSFVMIGIKPTSGGADFFTAVDGDRTELRDAQSHLQGVIDRLFDRREI